MNSADARAIAHQAHVGRRNRHGDLMTEHLERVAAAVPPDLRTVAFLHDILEHSDLDTADLAAVGLSDEEFAAVLLLTRADDESFEAHSLRIAFATGVGAPQARTVKLADLEDHMSSRRIDGAPPYGWARQHLNVCRDRRDRRDLHATAAA
jgi:hypothetical protein